MLLPNSVLLDKTTRLWSGTAIQARYSELLFTLNSSIYCLLVSSSKLTMFFLKQGTDIPLHGVSEVGCLLSEGPWLFVGVPNAVKVI